MSVKRVTNMFTLPFKIGCDDQVKDKRKNQIKKEIVLLFYIKNKIKNTLKLEN